MDQYCVVVCGLLAGVSDEVSAWLPVATALKLDQAEFERRVVAALPRIVRRDLSQAKAEHIAQVLQAMHVDARVLPDDSQLVYLGRAGTTRGPLPQSSLGDFIQPGESYRLRGDPTWQPWAGAPDPSSAASATRTIEFDHVDDATSPDTMDGASATVSDTLPNRTDDEQQQTVPTSPIFDDGNAVSNVAQDTLPGVTDVGDEPHHAMPPPLPEPPSAPPIDTETTLPTMDADESIHDDELIDPPEETVAPADPDAAVTPEDAAPRRWRTGRVVVLLVLVALAAWAYRHWMADTRVEESPGAPALIQPPDPAGGQPVAPARVEPGHDPAPTPVSAASVAPATSAPAPAATAAAPTTANPTPAPAGTTATPPVAAAPAPATSTETAATVPARLSGTLPARAGTIVSVQPARAASVPSAEPATPASTR